MTRNDILTEVYNSQIINKMASKYLPRFKNNDDLDDYIGECLKILCELPEDKLINLYNDGELYFYAVAVAKNQLFNAKSNYHKLMQHNIIKVEYNAEED